MAQHQQYYQIVTQDQIIQTVSLEELQRFYPNLCVESNTGVQYLINNQDDTGTQFQSQQVLVSTDQQIVLNTGESNQQIVVEQTQVNYQQPTQQYGIQEEVVTEYSQQNEINNSQQQIFYSPPTPKQPQQIIQQTPTGQMVTQIEQRQMVIQQNRAPDHVNQQQPIRQLVPQQQQQQINSHNILHQRRMQISQTQHVVTQSQQNVQRLVQPNAVNIHRQLTPNSPNIQRQLTQNITRLVQPNTVTIPRAATPVVNSVQRQIQQAFNNVPKAVQQNIVRMQYSVEHQNQQIQQLPSMDIDDEEKQQVLVDGRYMTMKQFKQEYSPNRSDAQQTAAIQDSSVQPQITAKLPPAKSRAPRRSTNPRGSPRANRANRGGKGNQNNQLHNQNLQQTNIHSSQQLQNHINDAASKPFQQITNASAPKQIQSYSNRSINQLKTPPMMQPPQRPPMQPSHLQPLQQIIQPQMQQDMHNTLPQPNIQHVANQNRQIPPQNIPSHISPHIQQGMQQHIPQGLQPHMQPQYQQGNRAQPLIPLSPHSHVPNGHVPNNAYSPPSNHGQNQYLDDSSNLSDDYKDSARMLVCLENGEQRLITFTLPKESCTVQDLLEQVGVPFNADTKIECISNPGSEIDYIVNVGAVNSASFPVEAQQVLSVENVTEPQECIISQSGKIVPITEIQIPLKPVKPDEPPPRAKSPKKPPEPPKEIPKFIAGCLAVCNHCGYLSEDFNRCQRCKTKLRDDVKSISNKLEEKEKKTDNPKCVKVTTPAPKIATKASPPNNSKPLPTPKTPRGRKAKAQDVEPVVLTLSSDDEDSSTKSSVVNSTNSSLKLLDTSVTLSAIQKEPVIDTNCDTEIDLKLIEEGLAAAGGSSDAKSTADILTTKLPCRTVRIGSFKFVPKEAVQLTTKGITIYAPALNDVTATCILFIPMAYIIKVLYSFNKSLPVLFFYVTPSVANEVRKQLGMKEGSDLYFDPLSKEEPHKRITLLPDIIVEETKNKIKEIYNSTKEYKMLEELSGKEANDILIRTCPKEATTQKQFQSVNISFSEMRQLLIYPPGKGGIAISNEDYLCLAQDQFLNDVIIDFYLKYLTTDVLDSPMQDKVYIFSSFFYKRLTTKPAKASKRTNQYEVDPNLTAAEKRHFRVKKWTKNVNIFEKDFVIIPINENMHWFLAIICYPGLDGCRSMQDANKIIKVPAKEKKKIKASITIGNTTITTVKATDDKKIVDKPIKCDEDEVCSDRDEAEGDESELEESDIETETPEEKKPNVPEPVKQPCILIFDSLAGAGRSRVVATLRDYLTCEYKAKLKSIKNFTKDNIKGACPKVPQQMNFTDCGLYVLQYVESFFKDPITDYRIPIKQLKNWFEEIVVTKKREDISNLIRELMLENNKNPNILPDIAFPTLNGELITSMDPNFSENEDEEEDEEEDGEHISEIRINLQNSDKVDDSLGQLQTYNSDSGSESPVSSSIELSPSSSKTKNSTPATSKFVVTTVSSPIKPDTNSESKKSNRETMSYLKSKRIVRHKNSDTNEVKKIKLDE